MAEISRIVYNNFDHARGPLIVDDLILIGILSASNSIQHSYWSAIQPGFNVVHTVDVASDKVLPRASADMRRQHRIGHASQWVVGAQGLVIENIEPRAGDAMVFQCVDEGTLVNYWASGCVNEKRR